MQHRGRNAKQLYDALRSRGFDREDAEKIANYREGEDENAWRAPPAPIEQWTREELLAAAEFFGVIEGEQLSDDELIQQVGSKQAND